MQMHKGIAPERDIMSNMPVAVRTPSESMQNKCTLPRTPLKPGGWVRSFELSKQAVVSTYEPKRPRENINDSNNVICKQQWNLDIGSDKVRGPDG